jgi:fused signal recognition particle receptor
MESWGITPQTALVAGVLAAVVLLVVLWVLVRRRRAAPPAMAEAPTAAEPTPAPAVPRIRGALAKTREAFRQRLADAFGRNRELDGILGTLEEALLTADVGVRTTTRIVQNLRAQAVNGVPDESKLRDALRAAIEAALGAAATKAASAKPWVVVVSGVNGVGKTTSIGKLAARFRAEGKKVLLVAADTFRAAAIDQLGVWAERVGADFVRHQSGSDPAAVAFDGAKAALARDVDVVLVDTAGRLHTRENLMEELRKVTRVIGKAIPGAPHEVWLVLDATTGQNAIHQAKVFSQVLGITGIVLTKLDGTAKGGAALAIREELGVPILYVGVGEAVDDLRPFDPGEFASGLVGD